MVSGQDLPFWQEAFVKFYQAFIEADRWKQYLQGVGTTVMITIMALGIGIVLGVMMAMVRTTHDQQRPGDHEVQAFRHLAVPEGYAVLRHRSGLDVRRPRHHGRFPRLPQSWRHDDDQRQHGRLLVDVRK